NAVLHYLAITSAAEIDWTIDDFERIRKRVPVIANQMNNNISVTCDSIITKIRSKKISLNPLYYAAKLRSWS
ncbi:MAG: hypothetical protein B7Y67_17870, partial [Polynucleobacter sp. 35-46-11]